MTLPSPLSFKISLTHLNIHLIPNKIDYLERNSYYQEMLKNV